MFIELHYSLGRDSENVAADFGFSMDQMIGGSCPDNPSS